MKYWKTYDASSLTLDYLNILVCHYSRRLPAYLNVIDVLVRLVVSTVVPNAAGTQLS